MEGTGRELWKKTTGRLGREGKGTPFPLSPPLFPLPSPNTSHAGYLYSGQ